MTMDRLRTGVGNAAAKSARRVRHALLRPMPDSALRLLRRRTMQLLYSVSPRGRSVTIGGLEPMQVEWERLAIDFATWEASFTAPFIHALRSLQSGDVVDVGASIGEWSALAAKIVGADRVHVIEPNRASWRHIKKVFALNDLPAPAGMLEGFIGAETLPGSLGELRSEWPAEDGKEAIFEFLCDPGSKPVVSLDFYCERMNCKPGLIKIDVEGYEDSVLRGGEVCLKSRRPLLFVSVHPEQLLKLQSSREKVLEYMHSLGYSSKLLGADHEEHWLFSPG
jgi:FkbM family methyltransferase